MNGAVSYHLKEAVVRADGTLRIDYSKAIFSRGELLTSHITEVIVEPGPVEETAVSTTLYVEEVGLG